jgi:hypothetical protein
MIDKTDNAVFSIGGSRKPLLDAAVDALKNISIPNGLALITFWGNKGVGKTALLGNIAQQFAADYPVDVVDVDTLGRRSVEEIKQAIWQRLETISLDRLVVVLLDDLDELLRRDGDSFFEFERTVIQSLIEKGNVLILCTSCIELNQWREDDVRIRQVNYQIQAMTDDEVMSLLSDMGIPAKKAYHLTFGHPKVAHWLRENPTLTDRQLARKSWEYFLEDFPEEARFIAGIIYCFALFNIFILQATYKFLTGQELDYLDCLEWIKGYIRRGLLYWDVSVGSYRFTDSAVRRLLARHVLSSDPDKFDKVQQVASEYFQSEARSPGYLHLHLVSAVYHMAQAERKLSQKVTGQHCLEWFRANRGTWQSARWGEVLDAWQDGAGEIAVREEIQGLIGLRQYNDITREIKKAGSLLEVKK